MLGNINLGIAPRDPVKKALWTALKQTVLAGERAKEELLGQLFPEKYLIEVYGYAEMVFAGSGKKRHDLTPYMMHCVRMAEMADYALELKIKNSMEDIFDDGRAKPQNNTVSHRLKPLVVGLAFPHDVLEDIGNISEEGLRVTMKDIRTRHPDFTTWELMVLFVDKLSFPQRKKEEINNQRKQKREPELGEVALYVGHYLPNLYDIARRLHSGGYRYFDVLPIAKTIDRIDNTPTLVQYEFKGQKYNPIREMDSVRKGIALCNLNMAFIEDTEWNPYLYFLHEELAYQIGRETSRNLTKLKHSFVETDASITTLCGLHLEFDLVPDYVRSRKNAQNFIAEWESISEDVARIRQKTEELGKRYVSGRENATGR